MEYSKVIPKELKSRLEEAFENFRADINNPWVISLLKHPMDGEQVYLIAKDPDEDTYYGIMEGQFAPNKEIYAIPVSNITCVEFCEVKITPFRAKPYIKRGLFEYQIQESKSMQTIFEEIQIGSQIWMRKNLSVEKFQNGDTILEAKSIQEWVNADNSKQPAWCYFDNNSTNSLLHGKLYNWHAVSDKRGLSPEGWKISCNLDWVTMLNFLGGDLIAARKLIYKLSILEKSKSESGFDGMLGGYRTAMGHFIGNGEFCSWWTSTEDGENFALSRMIEYGIDYIGEGHSNKGFGKYIRCIKK